MINITLYSNTSANNVVDKQLTVLHYLTGNLNEPTDISNPSLLLTDVDQYIGSCNYVYIQQLNRYYYVISTTSVNNGVWRLDCHIDVLKTYANTIRQQSGIIGRQEHNYNINLSDPRLRVKSNPYTQIKNFPNGFTGNYSFVLAFAGEGTTPPHTE